MRIWELFIGFNKEEFGYECMDRVGYNPVHTYLGGFHFLIVPLSIGIFLHNGRQGFCNSINGFLV